MDSLGFGGGIGEERLIVRNSDDGNNNSKIMNVFGRSGTLKVYKTKSMKSIHQKQFVLIFNSYF